MDDGNETLKNKGIKKSATIKNTGSKLRHKHKLECLLEEKSIEIEQTIIQSKKHQLQTITQTKTTCSPKDSKRIMTNDGTYKTYAVGHYRTKVYPKL